MRVQIVSGIYADPNADFRTSYPINMRPVPEAQGVSQGFLRVNDGARLQATGPGPTRGGIEWQGQCYRVMGEKLVRVNESGTITELADIPGSDTVSMTYSFDRLAIAASGKLYYWDKSTLTKVTDPDLGVALDVEWVDGYFVTTDGEFIVVTELNDPTSVDPLKYGSSEVDPDPVKAVLRLRNELYAVNRHTIETFQNVGGTGFPFQVVRGAQVHRGAVGTHMCAVFSDGICFVGGGRNEAYGVYVGANGGSQKISTRAIDQILEAYTEDELAASYMEVMVGKGHNTVLIHLPRKTLCFDANATQALGAPAWYQLNGGLTLDERYPVRHLVWAYNRWSVGSPVDGSSGKLDPSIADVWGQEVAWQFGTPIVYNEAKGGIFHELELIGLTGSAALGDDPQVYTQYSLDGVEWSQPRYISAGKFGERSQRMRWFRNGKMTNLRMQRFGGTSKSPISVAALEAGIEGLAW